MSKILQPLYSDEEFYTATNQVVSNLQTPIDEVIENLENYRQNIEVSWEAATEPHDRLVESLKKHRLFEQVLEKMKKEVFETQKPQYTNNPNMI